jgi:transposase
MTTEETLFQQEILEERDRLFRETAKLRSQIEGYEDFENERVSFQNQLGKMDSLISQKDKQIHSLQEQVEYLKRKIFGKSSERFIPQDAQLRIVDFDGLELLPEEKELATSAKAEIEEFKNKSLIKKEKAKVHPLRKPLPESLPRKEVHLYPEGMDKDTIDPEVWVELEPEVTEVLECEPAKFYVTRIIRHKFVLKNKDQNIDCQIITAAMPSLPIARSYAGASLLADLHIDKYVYHIPFHRKLQMFKQLGINIPPPTANGWFQDVADLMRPAYYRVKELVLKTDYIQSDETTIPIINNEKHKTVKGYIWMVRSVMENLVFFHYDHGSRAQKVALELFRDYQGVIQSDGYAVYDMYENKKGVLPIGCWAHCRRHFTESLKEDKVRSEYALEQIGLLYAVERHADEENLSFEERSELRSRLSYPIMVAFEKWLVSEYPKVLPKGRIGKAIHYTYNIYHKLTRYHLDGRLKPDNNLGELSIRAVAMGRQAWLFCGNHDAAENAAIMYTLFGCCKAHNVNFRDWLVYFLNHVHEYDDDYSKNLDELLPHNYLVKSSENLANLS